MNLKTILLFCFSFSAYFGSAQCDDCLQEFDEVAALPQTKLVILGKIISFKIDTNFETYHYEDSNYINTDSGFEVIDTSAKIWDTIVRRAEYINVEVLKIFKGVEIRKMIKIWSMYIHTSFKERLTNYSFEKGGIYYLALSESGLYYDSVLLEDEPIGDYCVYSYGFRALRLAKDSVYYLSDENVLLNKRPTDSSSFEQHLKKYLLNNTYRKRHKITNEIHDDEIWLKIGIVHISGDSMGVDVNGQFYKFNENYRKIKIKKGKWNSIDGSLIVLIPKKTYNTYFFCQEPGRYIYRADTIFKSGMGCYRFKFLNSPKSVQVEQLMLFEIQSMDTDYFLTMGEMNKYLGMKNILLRVQDSIYARIKLSFSMNEMYTITYDFLRLSYKVKFDGFLDDKTESILRSKNALKHLNYSWPDWSLNRKRQIKFIPRLVDEYY